MWTYILGPFLALLPRVWRDACSFTRYAQPARATVISGLAEFLAAILALAYWYMYAMTKWIDRGLETAMTGLLGPVTDHAIASVALSLWATHPLTWLLAYFMVEGAVRLSGAAFAENILGTLPFFLFDKIFINPFRRRPPKDHFAVNLQSNLSSFSSVIRERLMVARLSEVPDQICFRESAAEGFLEIQASRRKEEWDPPRVVRYENTYYRLESYLVGAGPRPFRYTLRRLSAGVPARSVLLYSPSDVIVLPVVQSG